MIRVGISLWPGPGTGLWVGDSRPWTEGEAPGSRSTFLGDISVKARGHGGRPLGP